MSNSNDCMHFASAHPEPQSITKGIGKELFLCRTVAVDDPRDHLHLPESLLRYRVLCLGRIPSGVQSPPLGYSISEEHRRETAANVVLHGAGPPIGAQP